MELRARGRVRTSIPAHGLPGLSVALTLAVALVASLLVEVLAHEAALGIGLRPVADTFNMLATALFFGAGVLRYTRWKVTGEAHVAANSAALLVFAVATFPMSMATRTIVPDSASNVPGSLVRLLAVLAVAALLAPTLGEVVTDLRLRPRLVAGLGAAVVVVVFVLATVTESRDPALASSGRASAGLDAGAAVVWSALAGLSLRAGMRRRSPSALWSAGAMALIGVAAGARAAAVDGGRWSWVVGVAALTMLAALVSVANAVADAREALSRQGRALRVTSRALADSEGLLTTAEARREDLVHDARSMIGVLRVALLTLDRHEADLDAGSTHRLRAAMDIELERLGRLLDGSAAGPREAFAVSDVLDPPITTARALGLDVVCRLDDLWGMGRPDDLAHVARNLLANARAHAPGSRVTIRGETAGSVVRIHVEDDGPGVPVSLGDRVFDRGVSAGPGRGSGLGLNLARRLMRDQAGDLEVSDGPGGARFVISLPAATPGVMDDGEDDGRRWLGLSGGVGEREPAVGHGG